MTRANTSIKNATVAAAGTEPSGAISRFRALWQAWHEALFPLRVVRYAYAKNVEEALASRYDGAVWVTVTLDGAPTGDQLLLAIVVNRSGRFTNPSKVTLDRVAGLLRDLHIIRWESELILFCDKTPGNLPGSVRNMKSYQLPAYEEPAPLAL